MTICWYASAVDIDVWGLIQMDGGEFVVDIWGLVWVGLYIEGVVVDDTYNSKEDMGISSV